jgi:hypothetical protein
MHIFIHNTDAGRDYLTFLFSYRTHTVILYRLVLSLAVTESDTILIRKNLIFTKGSKYKSH